MIDWHDIATAPKDRRVLLWRNAPHDGYATCASWSLLRKNWCFDFEGDTRRDKPTHWAELTPPTSGAT